MWKAAQQDAGAAGETTDAYLARVRKAIASFYKTVEADGLPRVVNHEATLAALRTLADADNEGALQLLTGPRSVGKSLMLRKVAALLRKSNYRVVLIDGRQHNTDLARAVVTALTADLPFFETVLQIAPDAVKAGVSALAAESGSPAVKAIVSATLNGIIPNSSALRLDQLLGTYIAACKRLARPTRPWPRVTRHPGSARWTCWTCSHASASRNVRQASCLQPQSMAYPSACVH